MPIEKVSGDALQEVLQGLTKLPKRLENTGDVNSMDTSFLKGVMDSPIVQSLAKVHDTLARSNKSSVVSNVAEIVARLQHDLDGLNNNKAEELCQLLNSPHMKQVIAAHDSIARDCFPLQQKCNHSLGSSSNSLDWETPVRMIGLTKRSSESLGLTVALKNDEIVVTRILHGGLIANQGLMHVGDIIREIDGKNVQGDPDSLKRLLRESSGSFTLKIIPSYHQTQSSSNMFMKCNFGFDHRYDKSIPSIAAGLSFKQSDVLKIVNHDDLQWWQAQHVDNKGQPVGRAGLIPSLELQERRRVLTSKSSKARKKLNCKMYKLSDYYQEYSDDYLLYEEVALLPPFARKCVLLVSHDSSIAHHVKQQLVESFPDSYNTPVIHTSNAYCRDDGFEILEKEVMLRDIKANKFFEFAETKGLLEKIIVGTKYDSIRNIIKSGKACVKDVLPKNLKFLMTSEFMPFVIFLKPENDIAESLAHCMNLTLPYYNVQDCANAVHTSLAKVAQQHQWVPISWLY